jgi:hypothetical protein
MKNKLMLLCLLMAVSSLFGVYHRIGGIDYGNDNDENPVCTAIDEVRNLFFATLSDRIQVYDIQDVINPILITEIQSIGSIRYASFQDNNLYVCSYIGDTYQVGLFYIIDITNPETPNILFQYYNYISDGLFIPLKLITTNEYCYVNYYDPATNDSEFHIFDISNPILTSLLGTFSLDGEILDFAVNGDFCYLSRYSIDCSVLDISDPTYPILPVAYNNIGAIYAMTIKDDIAYFCCSISGFLVYDVSDPFEINELSYVDRNYYNCYSVTVEEDKAYIADGTGGMDVINVDDSSNPVFLGNYDTQDNSGALAKHLTILDDVAFLATHDFLFIDVSNHENLYLVNSFDDSYPPHSIAVVDDNLVAVNPQYDNIIKFYSLADPASPDRFHSEIPLDVHWWESVYFGRLFADNQYLFAQYNVEDHERLAVVDISDMENIHTTDDYNISTYFNGDIIRKDSYVYFTCYQGIYIYELDENGQMSYVMNFPEYSTWTIDFKNDILCISYEDGLAFLDASDSPPTLDLLADWPTPSYITDIKIIGRIAYLIVRNHGIYIVDISNIQSPEIISTINLQNESSYYENLTVVENHLSVNDRYWNTIISYDVSNPEHPTLDFTFPWNMQTYDLEVYEDYFYTANRANGLSILNFGDTSIDYTNAIPSSNPLLSNHPNPFNPSTTISFNAPQTFLSASVEIYNIKGQKVDELSFDSAQDDNVVWNATGFSSGVYFYKLLVDGEEAATKKMLLLK